MRELTILPELEEFIPKLQNEEYTQLEENILEFGIRDPICVWKHDGDYIIVDGHNRYSIATKHDLSFETAEYHFEDVNEAKRWMIKNQLGRRNLTNYDRTRLALALHPAIVESNRKALTENPEKKEKFDAREKIAEIAGVGAHTVDRVAKIEKKADEKTKQALSRGEMSINKAYRQIKDEEEAEKKKNSLEEADTFIDIFNTDMKFKVVFADVPDEANPNSLPIPTITEPNAVLFLWTSPENVFNAKEIIDAWGFEYQSMFIWDRVKEYKEEYNSMRHELLLICTKGVCFPDKPKRVDSVQCIESSDDEKPKKFRNIINDMYSGEKIELYSELNTNGWYRWC